MFHYRIRSSVPNVISFLFCIEMVLVVAGQGDGYFAFDVANVG